MAEEANEGDAGEEVAKAVSTPAAEDDAVEKELSTGLKLPLSAEMVEEIWALGEDHEAQKALLEQRLTEAGNIQEAWARKFQAEVIVDFHLHNLIHCKRHCLTTRKAAVFHAIMQYVLDSMQRKSAGTARPGESYTSVEAFSEYQQLMLKHSSERPPERLEIFLGSEGRLLTDYISLTFFKHYLLYQYCLVFPRETETLRVEVSLDKPLAPPSLKTAKLLPEAKQKAKGSSSSASSSSAALPKAVPSGYPGADETQLPPDFDAASGGQVEPAVQTMIDQKIQDVERKLDERLDAREAKFKEKMQSLKG